jgi:hypothetical protein
LSASERMKAGILEKEGYSIQKTLDRMAKTGKLE